jgi:hypothetical protein
MCIESLHTHNTHSGRSYFLSQATRTGCTKEVFPAPHAAALNEPQRSREETKKRHQPALVQCLAPQSLPIGFSARQPITDESFHDAVTGHHHFEIAQLEKEVVEPEHVGW